MASAHTHRWLLKSIQNALLGDEHSGESGAHYQRSGDRNQRPRNICDSNTTCSESGANWQKSGGRNQRDCCAASAPRSTAADPATIDATCPAASFAAAAYCSDSSVRLIWVSSTTRLSRVGDNFSFLFDTFILLCITLSVVRSLSSQVGLP